MALEFGVFDHIEPVAGLSLEQIYRERLEQVERLDETGSTPITWRNTIPQQSTVWPPRRTCSWRRWHSAPGK